MSPSAVDVMTRHHFSRAKDLLNPERMIAVAGTLVLRTATPPHAHAATTRTLRATAAHCTRYEMHARLSLTMRILRCPLCPFPVCLGL